MKIIAKYLIATAILVQLSGCMNDKKAFPNDPNYAPTPPRQMPAPRVQNGAIYQAGYDKPLFSDRKARQIGDLLTIRLVEQTQMNKAANTKTDRTTTAAVTNPTILGSSPQFNAPAILPLASNQNNTLETNFSSNDHLDAKAISDQQNKLTGNITVTVSDVLSNGNLVIRGEKWLTLNQGDEFIRFTGIVRPEDIDSNNQVDSTRVGNARITYSGGGEVADSNAKPWFVKFFTGMLWPF